jgi:hypothetical protein
MGFSLWNMMKATLLVINGFAILNGPRFLSKHGLDASQPNNSMMQRSPLKAQAASLLAAVQWLKGPLIFFNSLVILFDMLFG